MPVRSTESTLKAILRNRKNSPRTRCDALASMYRPSIRLLLAIEKDPTEPDRLKLEAAKRRQKIELELTRQKLQKDARRR